MLLPSSNQNFLIICKLSDPIFQRITENYDIVIIYDKRASGLHNSHTPYPLGGFVMSIFMECFLLIFLQLLINTGTKSVLKGLYLFVLCFYKLEQTFASFMHALPLTGQSELEDIQKQECALINSSHLINQLILIKLTVNIMKIQRKQVW